MTVWGKELKAHFEPEKLEKGALVKIRKLEPTLIRTPMLNDDGTVSGYRESQRNNWLVENQAVERERSHAAPKEITLQPDATRQPGRKHERQHDLGFTAERGYLKNSPEHKLDERQRGQGFEQGY